MGWQIDTGDLNLFSNKLSDASDPNQNTSMNQQIPRNLSAKDLAAWFKKNTARPILVDVREEYELESEPFSLPVVNLPLSQVSIWIDDFRQKFSDNQPIVVICHAGIRSWNFGQWVLDQNWGYEVWNLEGGIEAWNDFCTSTLSND